MRINLVILFIFAVTITGCAGGRSYDYRLTPIQPHLKGAHDAITLGVYDQRNYIKNGEKYPQYVGTQRTPAYVPWNINTKSGSSMADDFAVSIKKALESDGYIVHDLSLSEKENRPRILARLKKVGDDRILLFTIDEWYFDVWGHVRMEYSLKLEVLDDEGAQLAQVETGKKMWGDSDNAVPDLEFKSAVEALLSDPHVTMALDKNITPYSSPGIRKNTPGRIAHKPVVKTSGEPKDGTEHTAACTTDQILKMKKMGMSDKQVKAACW